MANISLVIFAVIITLGAAEVVTKRSCKEFKHSPCDITEVRITPCGTPSKCIIKKGTNASLSFDFTPGFAASNLQTDVGWESTAGYVSFNGMENNDGCAYTGCPTEVGKSQTFDYSLYIGKKLPKGIFPIKWKLWNKDDEKQMCCFRVQLELLENKK